MTHSLNEIEALSKRAARGSGLSWGLAEEAAKGVRWLASYGLPGPRLLADLLDLNDRRAEIDVAPMALEGIWKAPAGRMSPIIAGASLSDCAGRLLALGQIQMQSVSYPLLLVPFLGGAALRLAQPVAAAWDGVHLVTDGRQLCMTEDAALTTTLAPLMTITAPAQMSGPRAPVQRAQVSPDSWARLSGFAHRTFAPATEESRLRGAGAGVSNND
ncbi:DUF3726 domain-containing protein [uncultured Tateyamaria sp.]|uniref:DUF3726 domain-containing protein n=1 Tax=Tateyamaria sp. 1078 TaxID=3417464 RepID=UPI00260D5F85|nr:DUF3726 domain-containing protein [uncultured Tateyamaria sp.]